ncbi:MAG: NAD-dependent epimerase/dehydratase family protein [Gemmatimonadetes bacterium]|nr:NAD-dependent epimerase/dehydratase family protein [Gemmatimonadota bacterium]
MALDRREFLKSACVLGGGVTMGSRPACGATVPGADRASRSPFGPGQEAYSGRPKRLLILGGTGFIGPHMVRYAVDRGHEVTIFTRGRSQADIPEVEHLIGDRSGDLAALGGRSWDVVLDNNARDYRWVELSTELLKDAAEQYVFVSSISAFSVGDMDLEGVSYPLTEPIVDEDAPLFSRPAEFEEGQEAPYGLSKTLGEQASEAAFPGRATVVRPGLIVGPGDPTDRFTYWPARIDRGGEILAPGDGSDPTQIIDVRDLTEWIVRLAEIGTYGVFNATGPGTRMSMAEMLYGVRAITSSPVSFTWVPLESLQEHGVRPWSDMPAWIPNDPISFVNVERAVAAGLTYRPLADTALDTLTFHKARPEEERTNLQAGIAPERELEVLAAWHGAEG